MRIKLHQFLTMEKTADQLHLIPPYCPNSKCMFHFGTEEIFYVRNGWTKTQKPPFYNQRYKCKSCEIQFSQNTFGLDYRKRLADISERILHWSMKGMSNNSIASLLKIAEGTVRERLREMARQSVFFEKENEPRVINENVAYDGFETFTYSQFSPCYINTAVGKNSHFIYHNTFSPLNRKGRMTETQKKQNTDLIKEFGLYPQNSVFEETCYIFKNLSLKAPGKIIWTDEHRAYLRAYRSFDCQLEHKTISSLARRDSFNPLFPINRLHNLYRHFLSSQHRETISFQKNEAGLLEKIQLMKIYRNFMNPKFVKKSKFDPYAHEWSPAMYLGITEKVLQFSDVFGVKKMKTQLKLDEREMNFLNRIYPYSRRIIARR